MEKLVIEGKNKLVGNVNVSGAKNAAVAILPACILAEDVCRIENIPDIEDVHVLIDILNTLGAKTSPIENNCIEIDTRDITSHCPPYDLVKKMRASYYLLGSLAGRVKKAEVALPGGCNFGFRPIDQHMKGFKALNCDINTSYGVVKLDAPNLKSGTVYLDVVSVGATINIMLAGCRAIGTTVIENAAKEPHIVDLANFLNSMGANIKGAGTDLIKIKGVEKLKGCTYSIIPDQIEAGTFMIAAAATGGDVTIGNIIPKHLEPITAKLEEMNVKVVEYDDSIRILRDSDLQKVNLKTLPYPGFPTDLQPQMAALLSITNGTSIIKEGVWDSRFQYVEEFKRLGANIRVEGRLAIVEGVKTLTAAPVNATDLRAGAGLIIGGLIAKGATEIQNINYIDRGYEGVEKKFKKLGAKIQRMNS